MFEYGMYVFVRVRVYIYTFIYGGYLIVAFTFLYVLTVGIQVCLHVSVYTRDTHTWTLLSIRQSHRKESEAGWTGIEAARTAERATDLHIEELDQRDDDLDEEGGRGEVGEEEEEKAMAKEEE